MLGSDTVTAPFCVNQKRSTPQRGARFVIAAMNQLRCSATGRFALVAVCATGGLGGVLFVERRRPWRVMHAYSSARVVLCTQNQGRARFDP